MMPLIRLENAAQAYNPRHPAPVPSGPRPGRSRKIAFLNSFWRLGALLRAGVAQRPPSIPPSGEGDEIVLTHPLQNEEHG